jgi:hypothetical protein
MREQRTEHVGKSDERQFELALHARRFDHGRRSRSLVRVVEQRGLADAGFTANGKSAAAAGRRLLEEPVDARSLLTPPYEHPANGRRFPRSPKCWGFPGGDRTRQGATICPMEQVIYSKRLVGSTKDLAPGTLGRIEAELPDGARLESEMVFADATTFREHGTIVFGPDSALRFRTLGTGHLASSASPGLRHGTVAWEVDGGSGRLAGASGRITSNFTVTEEGEVADEQIGLIFLSHATTK